MVKAHKRAWETKSNRVPEEADLVVVLGLGAGNDQGAEGGAGVVEEVGDGILSSQGVLEHTAPWEQEHL